ncbi:adenylate/guanylate cyclase domain-containing protein [Gordonia sp. ABSL49_1]|uniref:adenylate/guanylate cyclase domain-containing protein n=1 Tax=unclassified Gordonia (in: high G+C Gram-positive bacteria) TaxID=2657482 RepID=UPI001F0F5DAE|nr:adenylate/guanylate cyclase domain-containing protein [Gordonia sp. ABSL49_1]MCH5641040.1 adenylate/guanylate cyclase domain-containing protein [Gordonia sp. ABSL49_1]
MSEPTEGQSEDTAEYTRDELIANLGIPSEHAEKIWNAFGFPRRRIDTKIFSRKDLEALRIFSGSEDVMEMAAQVSTARSIGQSMARLAEWQADQLVELDADPDVPWSVPQMADALEKIQQFVWRRHLMLALERRTASEASESLHSVVGFADIVGYTSLSRRIGLAELQSLLDAFEERTYEIITELDGSVVKTLGDAVMFTFHEPAAAAMAAVGIHRLSESQPIPELRAGLARGEVLTRLGDVFGEPVNIAARLCGSARPGTTLVDESVSNALRSDNRFYLKQIPTLSVRGYKRLRAFALEVDRRADEDELEIPELPATSDDSER